MNQIVRYVLMFGVLGVFLLAFYQAGLDDISKRFEAQEADAEKRMLQMGERVALIGFAGTSPLEVDVMNTGEADVNVRDVLVDGHIVSYRLQLMKNGTTTSVLPMGEVVRVETGTAGSVVAIITHNDKAFKFRGG
ncbi:MAG: hypothetical protein OXK17_05135 [Thaumarchaeota archaeon]|nr:hypothetical protein [Nitrososphaerota archaeon]